MQVNYHPFPAITVSAPPQPAAIAPQQTIETTLDDKLIRCLEENPNIFSELRELIKVLITINEDYTFIECLNAHLIPILKSCWESRKKEINAKKFDQFVLLLHVLLQNLNAIKDLDSGVPLEEISKPISREEARKDLLRIGKSNLDRAFLILGEFKNQIPRPKLSHRPANRPTAADRIKESQYSMQISTFAPIEDFLKLCRECLFDTNLITFPIKNLKTFFGVDSTPLEQTIIDTYRRKFIESLRFKLDSARVQNMLEYYFVKLPQLDSADSRIKTAKLLSKIKTTLEGMHSHLRPIEEMKLHKNIENIFTESDSGVDYASFNFFHLCQIFHTSYYSRTLLTYHVQPMARIFTQELIFNMTQVISEFQKLISTLPADMLTYEHFFPAETKMDLKSVINKYLFDPMNLAYQLFLEKVNQGNINKIQTFLSLIDPDAPISGEENLQLVINFFSILHENLMAPLGILALAYENGIMNVHEELQVHGKSEDSSTQVAIIQGLKDIRYFIDLCINRTSYELYHALHMDRHKAFVTNFSFDQANQVKHVKQAKSHPGKKRHKKRVNKVVKATPTPAAIPAPPPSVEEMAPSAPKASPEVLPIQKPKAHNPIVIEKKKEVPSHPPASIQPEKTPTEVDAYIAAERAKSLEKKKQKKIEASTQVVVEDSEPVEEKSILSLQARLEKIDLRGKYNLRKFKEVLEALNCRHVRTRGGHAIWENPEGRIFPVPAHGEEIKRGTAKGILDLATGKK